MLEYGFVTSVCIFLLNDRNIFEIIRLLYCYITVRVIVSDTLSS